MEKKYVLYKRGRNSILQWVGKTTQELTSASIVINYGLFDGDQVIRRRGGIRGKNINKANQTSPLEQANLELESKVMLKKREGYTLMSDLIQVNQTLYFDKSVSLADFLNKVLPKYNTDINGNEIPMKCQQYYKSKKDWVGPDGKTYSDRKYYYMDNPFAVKEKGSVVINFPSYVQPKVNGVRAFIKMVYGKAVIFSKKGLVYKLPHISQWFENNTALFDVFNEDVIFDGELFIEGESLQNIGSAVDVYQINTLKVKYHVFDIAIEDVSQKDRFVKLYSTECKEAMRASDADNQPVVLVPTKICINDERAQILTDEYIAQGYEGAVFRDMEGYYEFGKRPSTITKLKRFIDEEFEIIDVIPTLKDQEIGLFVCITKGGETFKVNPKGDIAYKKNILINREYFIGKQLTCSFFEYTDAGVPFHISNNTVRDYE